METNLTVYCNFKFVSILANLNIFHSFLQIRIFTHLKLCLADAIHNFKWVKIQIE